MQNNTADRRTHGDLPAQGRRAPMTDAGEAFRIVVVCTGNRFRSPLVAALLREFAEDVPVEVCSTGTLDLGPAPALLEAVRAATMLDVDLSDHVAQPLTPEAVARADLVVGFEREHVAKCVVELGVPRERVFTLPELARLLARVPSAVGDDQVERARNMIAAAHEVRARDPWTTALAEIRDPLGLPRAAIAEIVEELRTATETVSEALFDGVSHRRENPAHRGGNAG